MNFLNIYPGLKDSITKIVWPLQAVGGLDGLKALLT